MIPITLEHLTCLGRRLEDYFPSNNVDEFDWILNPFVKMTDSNFEMCEEKGRICERHTLNSSTTL